MFPDQHWCVIRDGDLRGLRLYERHYSARPNGPTVRGEKNWNRFVGPGESLILLTACGAALFVWRREMYRQDGQEGVNCAVFRNEGYHGAKSSDLIREAAELAWRRWPGQRLFTFVNPDKVASTNPGYCFKMAGWKTCGLTQKGLVILECEV